jgi:hypothetical protein
VINQGAPGTGTFVLDLFRRTVEEPEDYYCNTFCEATLLQARPLKLFIASRANTVIIIQAGRTNSRLISSTFKSSLIVISSSNSSLLLFLVLPSTKAHRPST